jgi:hypothetical protein
MLISRLQKLDYQWYHTSTLEVDSEVLALLEPTSQQRIRNQPSVLHIWKGHLMP